MRKNEANMRKNIVDGFAILGVILAAYFGYRSLSTPGISVQGVPELTEEVRRGNELTEGLRDAMTPDDAIASLSQRGYNWTLRDFLRALEMQDDTSVDLFCNAGPKAVFDGSLTMMWRAGDIPIDRIVGLKDCAAFDATSICASEQPYGADAKEFDWTAFGQMCSPAEVTVLRTRVAGFLDAELAEAKTYCAQYTATSERDKTILKRNFLLNWTQRRTWHRFGGPYDLPAFCEQVATY